MRSKSWPARSVAVGSHRHEHDFGVGLIDFFEQSRELPRADHAGLIDHQHRAIVELIPSVIQILQQ